MGDPGSMHHRSCLPMCRVPHRHVEDPPNPACWAALRVCATRLASVARVCIGNLARTLRIRSPGFSTPSSPSVAHPAHVFACPSVSRAVRTSLPPAISHRLIMDRRHVGSLLGEHDRRSVRVPGGERRRNGRIAEVMLLLRRRDECPRQTRRSCGTDCCPATVWVRLLAIRPPSDRCCERSFSARFPGNESHRGSDTSSASRTERDSEDRGRRPPQRGRRSTSSRAPDMRS